MHESKVFRSENYAQTKLSQFLLKLSRQEIKVHIKNEKSMKEYTVDPCYHM